MPDLGDYPPELVGGYYDGARLLGTRDGGDVAEYYDFSSHGVVRFAYNEEKERLDAAANPQHELPRNRTVDEYVVRVQRNRGGYDRLTPWIRARLHDERPDGVADAGPDGGGAVDGPRRFGQRTGERDGSPREDGTP